MLFSLSHICVAILTINGVDPSHKTYETRLKTCVSVVDAANKNSIDPSLFASISWVESGFFPNVTSRAGAKGPLQVIPKYFCPRKRAKGCDLIAAGVKAWKAWSARSLAKSGLNVSQEARWAKALCHYNNGNTCYSSGKRYARRILNLRSSVFLFQKLSTPPYPGIGAGSDGGIP